SQYPINPSTGLPATLPEGFQRAQVVVVGQSAVDTTKPGLASAQDHAFRIDNTPPQVASSSLAAGSTINQLSSISLSVVDNSNPTSGFLATPSLIVFPAIDPASASNVSNYSLLLNNPNGTQTDESQFISSATFVAGTPVASGGFIIKYTGTISLTI